MSFSYENIQQHEVNRGGVRASSLNKKSNLNVVFKKGLYRDTRLESVPTESSALVLSAVTGNNTDTDIDRQTN